MIGRRSAISALCILAALALTASAAPGAGAVTKGTTAFTCAKKVPEGGAGFSKEHCKAADAVASGAKYEHLPIAENTTTELRGTNQKTGVNTDEASIWRLKATLNGVSFELSATGVALGEGAWLENKRAANGEHYIHGEGKLHLTGVKMTKPVGMECIVEEETVISEQLTLTSEGQGDALLLKPAVVGNPFASFVLEECPLAGPHTVFGQIKSTSIDGATATFTHANTTAQGTLFIDNEFTPAGLAGTLTLSGSVKGKGVFNPLSVTTVETP